MNFAKARDVRIKALENKISRVTNALVSYPYTKASDILDDLSTLEGFQKELEVQKAYSQIESNLQ